MANKIDKTVRIKKNNKKTNKKETDIFDYNTEKQWNLIESYFKNKHLEQLVKIIQILHYNKKQFQYLNLNQWKINNKIINYKMHNQIVGNTIQNLVL